MMPGMLMPAVPVTAALLWLEQALRGPYGVST